jgi:uncharacterized membrane protein
LEGRLVTHLVLAAATFAAMHLLISGTRARDALVARLGEKRYRALFSLASAAVLGWLIWSFTLARAPALTPLIDWRWLAAVLVLAAFLLIVLGLLTPGPTIVGAEKLLAKGVEARGIHRVTRHPFLWGIALWGAVHAAYNPEAAHLRAGGGRRHVLARRQARADVRRKLGALRAADFEHPVRRDRAGPQSLRRGRARLGQAGRGARGVRGIRGAARPVLRAAAVLIGIP